MARAVRVRNLAREIGVSADDLLLWLIDQGAETAHEADFVPADIAVRAREAFASRARARPAATLARCALCLAAPAPGGRAVRAVADPALCERCGGSTNRRSAAALLDAFERRGLTRLLVVGGGPGTADELRRLLDGLEVRVVDGTAHNNIASARADLGWSDIAVVWGSTILAHKVSKLYTDQRAEFAGKLVVVPRRGVAALCETVVERLGEGA